MVRLSSTNADYDNTCGILFQALSKRNYSRSMMRKMKREIWQLDSDVARKQKEATAAGRLLPIIVPYNDVGTQLARVWRQAIVNNSIFADARLITAYTMGRNLRRSLVRSRLQLQQPNSRSSKRPIRPSGNSLCTNTRCRACTRIIPTRSFSSSHNNRTFTVRGHINCKTSNIVYLVTCRKCNQQYVGETSRPLADRINDHLSAIRLKKPTPISIHFNITGHSIADFRIMGIQQFDDSTSKERRRMMETTWQNLLQTSYPCGINNLKKTFI